MEDDFGGTVLHFTDVLLKYLEKLEQEPLAFKVPALPGWRVAWGKFESDLDEMPTVYVAPIQEWGFLAPDFKLMSHKDMAALTEAEDFSYLNTNEINEEVFLEEARRQLSSMWPIDSIKGTAIIRNLYSIFPPTDQRSDEEIRQEVIDYVSQTNETLEALKSPPSPKKGFLPN